MMNCNVLIPLVVVWAVSGAAGCATIVHGGTTQKIKVQSNPEGATVEVNGSEAGRTPATVKLKRGKDHTVVVKKEGYEPKTVQVQNGMSGWIAGNILLGGLIGIVVDAVSGGGYNLDPEEVNTTLEPLQRPVPPAVALTARIAPEPTAAAPAPSRGPTGIAIYPLGAKGGISPALAEGLSSVFAAKVAETPCTRLVGEDVIRDLARQQGLEQSCGTESCQVDLAKQAKADILVRGDISQVGSSVLFTAIAIDLATKQTLYSETLRSDSTEDELIRNSQELASRLSGRFACAM